MKHFAASLAKPVRDVIFAQSGKGSGQTVPKIHPLKTIEDLRNISGLLNLDKVAEKIIYKMMISDMKKNIDPSQFANQKGQSIQHYLVKMIELNFGSPG